jgi:hypothetical protein
MRQICSLHARGRALIGGLNRHQLSTSDLSAIHPDQGLSFRNLYGIVIGGGFSVSMESIDHY